MQATTVLLPVIFLLTLLIIRSDRRIIRTLRRAGAVHPGITSEVEAGNFVASWRLRRFLRFKIVVEVQPGRYYLDENRYLDIRKKKAMIVLAVIATASIIAVLFLKQG